MLDNEAQIGDRIKWGEKEYFVVALDGIKIGISKWETAEPFRFLFPSDINLARASRPKTPVRRCCKNEAPVRDTNFRIPDNLISQTQRQCERIFCETDKHLIMESRAGGGKTTMLKHLASFQKEGQRFEYLAFNRKNAEEGRKKLPRTVKSRTFHAFCFEVIKNAFDLPKAPEENKTWRILEDLYPSYNDKRRKRVRGAVNRLTGLCKNWACEPGDIGAVNDVFDRYVFDLEQDEKEEVDIDDLVVDITVEVLEKSVPSSEYGMVYDLDDMLWWTVIEKVPLPKRDVIFCDEAQDFNASQIDTCRRLMEAGTRIVMVADPYQCVIEGTPITTSDGDIPAENLHEGEMVVAGKGNNETVLSTITKVYSKEVVDKPVVEIETESGFTLTCTAEHACFAGYNTKPESPLFWTYLMFKEGFGFRLGITSNRESEQTSYLARMGQERADAMWLLEAFDNVADATYYEHFLSVKYGIPTWVFYAEGRTLSYSQEQIQQLFQNLPTAASAKVLLDDLGMFIGQPHGIPKCTHFKRRRNFNVTLCGDSRGTGLHRYSISGFDLEDQRVMEKLGLNVRPAKYNTGWKVESSHKDMAAINEIHQKIQGKVDVHVIEKAKLTSGRALPVIPAAHVLPQMDIFVRDGNTVKKELVKSVTKFSYTGKVFDFDVERYHNFCAGGIFTHNSVYGFRGADCDSFYKLSAILESGEAGAKRVLLPTNYRCSKNVIKFVHEETIVKDIRAADNAIGGEVRHDLGYDEILDLVIGECETL